MSGIIGTSQSKSRIVGRSKDTAKAWGTLYYPPHNPNGVPTLTNSFNISSISDQGAGYSRISFSTAMANVNYAVAGMGSGTTSTGSILVLEEGAGVDGSYGRTTANMEIKSKSAFNNSTDAHNSTFIVFGD